MSFHSRPWAERYGEMGDMSEAAFLSMNPRAHRLGLNRTKMYMGKMTGAMRYTPDFLISDRFVECMGVGKDGLLKIKVEKLDALMMWTVLGPVDLFVYDSHNDTYYQAPLDQWRTRINSFGSRDTFKSDGKTYEGLDVEHFPTEPQPVVSAVT